MADSIRQTFASNLRAEFDARGLTQDDFCAAYNKRYEPQIQRTSVSRWLTCTQFPRSSVLENIADYFGRDVAWFFESSHPQKSIPLTLKDQPASEPPLDDKRREIIKRVNDIPDSKLDAILLYLDALQD